MSFYSKSTPITERAIMEFQKKHKSTHKHAWGYIDNNPAGLNGGYRGDHPLMKSQWQRACLIQEILRHLFKKTNWWNRKDNNTLVTITKHMKCQFPQELTIQSKMSVKELKNLYDKYDGYTHNIKSLASTRRNNVMDKYRVNDRVKELISSPNYVFINQGNTGACSFASLSHLCQLGGIDTPWNMKKLSTEQGFKKVYFNELQMLDEGYNSWALVFGLSIDNFKLDLGLTIENNYQFFKAEKKDIFNVLISDTSNKGHYADSVLTFLKDKLDTGFVIATPFVSHFITLIGYNDNGLLFLGSYGEDSWLSEKGGLHELKLDLFNQINYADAIRDCLFVKVYEAG